MSIFPRRRRAPAAEFPPLAERRLFIIGVARSGTTVLQSALNSSREVFLLGEPDLYGDEADGFRARYNAMHAGWGNQQTKGSHLPAFTRTDGGWRAHFLALARRHRWTGAKLVLNPVRAAGELERRFAFHAREFYGSRYIFTFRDPMAACASTRDLQVLTQGRDDGLRAIFRNYVEGVGLYIRFLRLLPQVEAVFHDRVDAATFERLGRWLGVPLPDALAYYDGARVRDYGGAELPGVEPAILEAVQQLYRDLREGAQAGFATPQLEQNDRHLSPDHYTRLGSLDRRARVLTEALSA